MNCPDGDDIRHGLGRNQRELRRRDTIVVQLDAPRPLASIVRPGDLAVVGHAGIVANSGILADSERSKASVRWKAAATSECRMRPRVLRSTRTRTIAFRPVCSC